MAIRRKLYPLLGVVLAMSLTSALADDGATPARMATDGEADELTSMVALDSQGEFQFETAAEANALLPDDAASFSVLAAPQGPGPMAGAGGMVSPTRVNTLTMPTAQPLPAGTRQVREVGIGRPDPSQYAPPPGWVPPVVQRGEPTPEPR